MALIGSTRLLCTSIFSNFFFSFFLVFEFPEQGIQPMFQFLLPSSFFRQIRRWLLNNQWISQNSHEKESPLHSLSYTWCCFNVIIIIGVSSDCEVAYDWFSIFVVFSSRNFVIGFFLVGKAPSLAEMRHTGSRLKHTSCSHPL